MNERDKTVETSVSEPTERDAPAPKDEEQEVEAMESPVNERPQKDKPSIKSKKKLIIGVALVAAVLIGTGVGYNMGRNAVISDEILQVNSQYASASEKLSDINDDLKVKQKEYKNFQAYIKNQAQLEADLASSEATLNDLNNQITAKQKELDRLTGEVLTATGQPITLNSGDYIVGTDLNAGRYIVSGSSNFQVWTSAGDIYINTILGNSSVGRGDYTATLNTGMIMHCASRTTFTPVS